LLQLSAGKPPTGYVAAVQKAAVLFLDLNLWDHVTPGMRQLQMSQERKHWRMQYQLHSVIQSIHDEAQSTLQSEACGGDQG